MGSEIRHNQPPTVDPETSNRQPVTAAPPPDSDIAGLIPPSPLPLRYHVISTLGSGGFGVVHMAFDEELKRHVAIKVPHRHRIQSQMDVEAYLAEARALARLDHRGIVPVYDVGRTEDGFCFIVSKYVEGSDLRVRMRAGLPSQEESVRIIAAVAEALHHAHQRGLVHRDIKPGNILLDKKGEPILADFGLALGEEDLGKRGPAGGTPQYMSPEQARGEGHRVDGRSDIYSLGVVLYELLTGRRPFAGSSDSELLEHIRDHEPRPPRQLNDSIPRELDRICLKALARRASDRYSTAFDLAEDLRHWMTKEESRSVVAAPSLAPEAPAAAPAAGAISAPDTERRPIKIVPKGLRSFDAGDADFFLELLPGPRDRERLPESLRFWKKRIEETDPDKTFTVGLVYGPSGCGKSSLIKAGLLPRLAGHIMPIFLEAAPEGTEQRLLGSLRRRCPDLPADEDLAKTLAILRRGRAPDGKKILIVLDQFEQWLHAQRDEPAPLLVRALRQCDGEHVQAVLLVRDDFWMATTRFLRDLEVPLVEGQNAAAVDLFDLRHARKVLAAYGRAFAAIPETDAAKEQEEFLEQAVAALAQDGKVIPVRLSLFAEMMKHKPWLPATLRKLGGMEGVGVAFLEETFSAASAPPEHRLHQKAARATLQALLPEPGTELKGHMRSYDELLEASGYRSRPQDFADLGRILDAELRLITPADPEGIVDASWPPVVQGADDLGSASTVAAAPAPPPPRFYQLTHDYLVPVLREWLTHKKKETWQGRAELRLAERAGEWLASRRQARFLPALPELLMLALAVPRRYRKPEEQSLIRAAARRLAARWGAAFLLALAIGVSIQQYVASVHRTTQTDRAQAMVDGLVSASPSGVQNAIGSLQSLRDISLPLIHTRFQESDEGSSQQLHAAFGLAAFGEAPEEFLIKHIPTAPSSEAHNMIAALAHASSAVRTQLLQLVEGEANPEFKARYAIVLLHLGDPSGTKLVLALLPNPTARTALIFALRDWHGDFHQLPALLRAETDSGFRSGLCAALGRIDPSSLSSDERTALINTLTDLYQKAPDGGTHSAAGWALRQWKAPLPTIPPTTQPEGGRSWFVNQLGMTMVGILPGRFEMGDGKDVNTRPHWVTLTRPFLVADTEVRLVQFHRLINDPTTPADQKRWRPPIRAANPASGSPATNVNWVDAILFCNWLSRREERKTCYQLAADGAWSCDWSANGYRLLTEAEWEIACRAGTHTVYSFGDQEEQFPEHGVHAQYQGLHAWPVASKLPNGFGLFDMHGNVREWCWDWYGPYEGKATDPVGPAGGTNRVARSGSFADFWPSICSSAARAAYMPDNRAANIGFRIACGAQALETP